MSDDSTKLVFDPNTSELRVVQTIQTIKPLETETMSVRMPCYGAARFNPYEDKLVIHPTSSDKETVLVKTMHISCQSDAYQPGHKYGGVALYQYNGKSDWRTANNTHCKSGYIVIQDTDSQKVKKWRSSEPGVVHGAVYRNAFGESKRKADVVGEGFAIQYGKFEISSGVFNNPQGSAFHDERRRMNEFSEHCVRKIVKYWKDAGPAFDWWSISKRTFEVKDLLKDFSN